MSSDGDSAFGHDNLIAGHDFSNLTGRTQDRRDIRRAISRAGSPYPQKNQQGFIHPLFEAGGEGQTAGLFIAGNNLSQARLIDGNNPFLESVYLLFVRIDTDNMVASVGHTCRRNQPNITHPNHGNPHDLVLCCSILASFRKSLHSVPVSCLKTTTDSS